MLSDRTLEVTDAFGLRNQGAHSGNPRDEIEALPVPASLLGLHVYAQSGLLGTPAFPMVPSDVVTTDY